MKLTKHFAATMILAALVHIAPQQALAQEQSAESYFLGEWNALLTGLPDGDLPFIINISVAADSLQASVYDESRAYVMPIEKVILNNESALTLSFYDYNNGVDVVINLMKKDEDNMTGNVLNMYNITATRRKQP